MSKSPRGNRNQFQSDPQVTPSKQQENPQNSTLSPKANNIDDQIYGNSDEERETIRQKLIQDANDLLDYVNIELTVGSQIESTKRRIKELSKQCREESRMIYDLEKQIEEEQRLSQELEDGTYQIENEQEDKETDLILQLEEELRSLYAEKSALLSREKKK